MPTLFDYHDFATALARECGQTMLQFFIGEQDVQYKDDNSPVTQADLRNNAKVLAAVAENFPEHGILAEEESKPRQGARFVWVCDPLDGTIPYTLGVPTSAFALALVDDGVPVVGVIYDPFVDRLYSAIKGEGAWLNGRPIHVSSRSFAESLLATTGTGESIYDTPTVRDQKEQKQLKVMRFTGAVYKGGLVACGKIDGFEHLHHKPYDIAATKIIVEEAGGKVTDLDGREQRYDQHINGAVVSNGVVHDALLEFVRLARSFGQKD